MQVPDENGLVGNSEKGGENAMDGFNEVRSFRDGDTSYFNRDGDNNSSSRRFNGAAFRVG